MLADMVQAAVNEAIRAAQELAASKMGGITGGLGGPAAALAGSASPACERVPVERGPGAARAPRRRALAAAGDRPAHRAAARLPHPARRGRGGRGARRGDPRGEGEGRPLRGLLQPRRGPALPDLRGRQPRPGDDLRGRGARRRDPDRAHPRVPRPLPRARRRALADRRRRPRGPADRRAAAPRRGGRGARGRPRHQPDDDRRGDRAAHRRAAARQGRASRGWPAACRSAPTSSTPTRSPSARRSPAAARWPERARLSDRFAKVARGR